MSNPAPMTLHATARAAAPGALAQARAVGLLPFTITDVRGQAIRRHAAVLDRAAFLAAWEHRSRYQALSITGLDEPLTTCVTAFNYCPVSHVVIHVMAIAYTPAQYHLLPIRWDAPSPALPTHIPAVCRATVPAAIALTLRADGSVPSYGECSVPAGVTVAGHEQDVIGAADGGNGLPTFERRPGR